MIFRFLFLSLFLSLFLCFSVIAQNPYSIDYNLEKKLPTSNVYTVFEDNLGYMWFATDVGVLKFDGYNFKHFNTDNGIADNEVFKIFQDSEKRIWFLTLNGKLSFYKNGIFYNGKTLRNLKLASHSKMLIDFFEDNKGFLHFLYTDGRIVILDKELENLKIYETDLPSYSLWKNKKTINVLTTRSIKNIFTKEEKLFNINMISFNGYKHYIDNGDIYFSSKNEIYKYVNNSFTKLFEVPKAEIIFLKKINNKFWIGTRKGLYIQDGDSLKGYFKDDIISGVIKDSNNNFWITTLNDGVKFIPNINVINHSFLSKKIKVNTLIKDKRKNLWIGTEKGLYNLNTKHNKVKLISEENNYVKKLRNYNDVIFSIGNNFINIYDNKKVEKMLFGSNDILIDNANYFFSTSVVFKFKKSDLSYIKNNFNNQDYRNLRKYKVFEKRTNLLAKSLDNSIYFGTSNGLYLYKNNFINKVTSKNEELNTSILDINIDSIAKRVVIATNSKGIVVLKDTDNSVTNSITSLNGLNSNGCNAILKFKNGVYFIATNKGLNKVIFKDSLVSVIDYNKIIKINDDRINDIEIIGSTFYLATNFGLISFDSNKIKEKKEKPKLIIENISIDGLIKNDLSSISYNNNNIQILYTGISYSDFGDLIYQYKFDTDREWTTTKNRQLNFKNLPNGNYSLNIRAKVESNTYSNIKTVKFYIKPPFWKTIPFILICMIIVVLIIRTRIKSIESSYKFERKSLEDQQVKTNLEKELIELEQKALRLQMNPHFIFNALNTIKGYYSGGKIIEANKYISKFSKLLRLILESDTHFISLKKEIEMLELYIKLIQLRYENVFSYEVEVSEDLIADNIGIPPLLIQPIVENAIIHGLAPNEEKGFLNLKFKIENKQLVCTIKDNGVGFPINKKKETHKSKAIKITKDRINFENNSIGKNNFIINHLKNPSGTEVILKIPLIKIIKHNENSNY